MVTPEVRGSAGSFQERIRSLTGVSSEMLRRWRTRMTAAAVTGLLIEPG